MRGPNGPAPGIIEGQPTLAYGRAARGRRALGKVPRGRRERLTVVGAPAPDGGVVATVSINAATGTAVFPAFAGQVLAPAPRERPGAIVVLGSPSAHKAEAVRDALGRAGLHHRHPPPCSPDLDPVEQAWPEPEARLRAAGARSREAREAALGPALATIAARDARGWFRLRGYPAPD